MATECNAEQICKYIVSPDDEYVEDIVLNNEPHVALFGGSDGMHFYKIILEGAKQILKEKNIEIENIKREFIKIEDGIIRHDSIKVGLELMNILIK